MSQALEKAVFLNRKQRRILSQLQAPKKWGPDKAYQIPHLAVLIAGRGFGKSTILAEYLFRCVDTMPRSRGALGGITFDVVLNRSLPSIKEHWTRMGLIEGFDYVIGKKPPADFEKPYNQVETYGNVISWWNGTTIEMVSLYDKKRSAKGANWQFFAGDEFALVGEDVYKTNVMPAMRGLYYKQARLEETELHEVPFGRMEEAKDGPVWIIPFKDNPFYLSRFLVSSMPWLESGKWLLNYEDDPEAIYVEGTARDNLKVLGPSYLAMLRKDLPDLIYRIEVENERIEQLPDGFYPHFLDSVHTTPKDHYQTQKALELSFDFGGFNSVIICQTHGNQANVLNQLFMSGKTVTELVEKFCEDYKEHKEKEVWIYGDRNGNSSQYNSKFTLYQEITMVLKKRGWRVINTVEGLDPNHADKHLVINQGLKEDAETQLPQVRINSIRAKYVIISIKRAGILENFKKDKRSERDKNLDQAKATHLSDCFDNWYYPKFKHLFRRRLSSGGGLLYMG